MTGPKTAIALWADREKYRQPGEEFKQKCARIAGSLSDNQEHYYQCYDILVDQRFLPGGRVQSSVGSVRETTAFNCFVMQTIPDSMEGIMGVARDAALTMQLGGGVGYDFSTIRPRGDKIKSLDSSASGPVSFMSIFDAVCGTIASAGHRRGAQMGCLRVDHPDILEFVAAKTNHDKLTNFNISVLVTDKFMEAVMSDSTFDLVFGGRVYGTVRATYLWDNILRATWDWAEPGVIFIDRVNKMNNLYYLEDISATNPCGEQPLPPYGACLLGSINWVKYVAESGHGEWHFDIQKMTHDIPAIVRMMDNVIDETVYPLPEQEREAKGKRRMGLGHTGVANALSRLGLDYGSEDYLKKQDQIMETFAWGVYSASISLAIEKGPFPKLNRKLHSQAPFVQSLGRGIPENIEKYGIRNSHLLSIAPTGTISLTADNVSSGIEPVFSHEYKRRVNTPEGMVDMDVVDYGYSEWGIKGKTSDEVSVIDHVRVLAHAQRWVDSSVSKTCNVGSKVTWEEFKDVYLEAYKQGAKGCTTFRKDGKRFGILNASASEDIIEDVVPEVEADGAACYIDLETGIKTCE